MAIIQSQIDTLITELEDSKSINSVNFAVAGLNGIRNLELEDSIIKLQVLINRLLNFDITNEDDTDEYFHNLRKESRRFCKLITESVPPTPENDGFFHQRFLITSTGAGAGAAIAVGFSLPSRSTYIYIDITLLGYNRLTIGDGVITAESYWSSDAGTTAKALNNLEVGDDLYVNANIIGAPISVIDQLEIILL